jgi:hypothetical protein
MPRRDKLDAGAGRAAAASTDLRRINVDPSVISHNFKLPQLAFLRK